MSRYRIALTGGIASGKTTVANLFAELGVDIVDTDVLAREVVEPGAVAFNKIVERFGAIALTPDGVLDRRALRAHVFSDANERKWLESITHPEISKLTDERTALAAGPYVIVAIPLLVETNSASRFDRVLVIDCDPVVQLARLQARDGNTREQAQRILDAQVPREARLAVADDVIRNDGDVAQLRGQVEQLHHKYRALAEAQAAKGAT